MERAEIGWILMYFSELGGDVLGRVEREEKSCHFLFKLYFSQVCYAFCMPRDRHHWFSQIPKIMHHVSFQTFPICPLLSISLILIHSFFLPSIIFVFVFTFGFIFIFILSSPHVDNMQLTIYFSTSHHNPLFFFFLNNAILYTLSKYINTYINNVY